jgi:hypothetical protein
LEIVNNEKKINQFRTGNGSACSNRHHRLHHKTRDRSPRADSAKDENDDTDPAVNHYA